MSTWSNADDEEWSLPDIIKTPTLNLRGCPFQNKFTLTKDTAVESHLASFHVPYLLF
jgi:hypothetical protein